MKKIQQLLFQHKKFIFLELLLVIMAISAIVSLNSSSNTVSIAVVLPMTGDKEQVSTNILKTLNIYAERINKYGGIEGHDLQFLPYDNKDDPKVSHQIATKIVDENKVVAVIQDFSHSADLNIEKIYEQANIPILLPTESSDIKHQWAFHISPAAEDYGKHMAYYVNTVLEKDSVVIAQSGDKTHTALVKTFIKSFIAMGGTVQEKIILEKGESALTTQANNIARYFNPDNESYDTRTMLLLSANESESVPFLVALKRNHQFTIPTLSSDNELGQRFNQYAEEKTRKGYFSEGIYVPSILLLDSVSKPVLPLVYKDYSLTYKDETGPNKINHQAISSVLAASFIVDGLKRITLEGKSLTALRTDIQQDLGNNNWFNDQNKGSGEHLLFGIFKNQGLITSSSNHNVTPSRYINNNRTNTSAPNQNNRSETDYVYTGVSMNKISNIDMANLTYTLDFFLWFRYPDEVKNADDIEFLNSVKLTKLYDLLKKDENKTAKADDKPTNSQIVNNDLSATLVESYSLNGESYRRYRITGRFYTNDAKNYALGQQNSYVRFRHHNINKYNLSYISDFVNSNKGVFNLENSQNNDNIIDNPSLQLSYNTSYINTSLKTRLGSIKEENQSIEFSEFTAEYRIKPILWSFRGIVAWVNSKISGREDKIDIALMLLLLSVSCSIFIFTRYIENSKRFEETSNYWWFLQLGIIFFILLFGELVISQGLYNLRYSNWGEQYQYGIDLLMMYTVNGIAMLWWLLPAYYITSAFEHFLWTPIKKRTGAEIPYVLRLTVTIFVYLLAALGIMAYVLEVTITGLAATSGIIAIVFAIASKVDLSNIIAGLGISLAKTFKLGDWVKINDVEGQVVEMTPRATKVLTFNSSIINIPNTTVSSAIIENYNRPDPAFRVIIHLEIVPVYRFERVEKVLLDAVSSTEGVLDTPEPFVIFKGQGDSSQIFEVAFFVGDYAKRYGLWQAAWRRIWRHLEQADIVLATPQREVFMPKVATNDIAEPCNVLENCGVFSNLPTKGKEALGKKMTRQRYAAGDTILRQGDNQVALFIITEGVVSFNTESPEGDIIEVKRLGVADVFGHLSLINLPQIDATAVARTDTEVLVIQQQDFVAASDSQATLPATATA